MSCVEVRDRERDSPERARSLLTVRAAISSARPSLVPRSRWLSLTCSYCRARFVPFFTPRGGIGFALLHEIYVCPELPGRGWDDSILRRHVSGVANHSVPTTNAVPRPSTTAAASPNRKSE